ncbi:hypothetical protein IMSAGC014_01120 [Bacteroidaceae bacterium]|uniref:DUF6359 domain-containing protein n=1 Tax=Prevotella sp. MGM2 TaxID=2033406 RepID=UPI000CEA59F2|nr:DUF6359 domain-containing protein [Prevotella sp. MGM2]GAY30402.1 hypothetical protein PvtlMGM2_1255 [Prevotella sp. MGM2]GFI34625.1 hypothetical protein IMSAGC014_01120 [Bacteroidaceae bacterium]
MPLRILPIFLLLLALLPSACGKIELPDEENSDTGNNQEEVPTEQTGDTLLPSQVLKCQTDTFICVSGYIVGYIRGTSLTHAIFGIPNDAPNSNMLLADRPSETSITNCLVVELSKNNDEVPREIINLYDHPRNYKKRIILIGYVTEYFRTIGLKNLYSYEWADSKPTDNESDNDTPPPSDKPTPGIDDNPQLIPDGR